MITNMHKLYSVSVLIRIVIKVKKQGWSLCQIYKRKFVFYQNSVHVDIQTED